MDTNKNSSLVIIRVHSWFISLLSRIRAEAEEPMFFGEAVHPVFFGDFVAGVVLAVAGGEGFDFGEGRAALGGVSGAVFFDEGFYEVGAFEDDAASRGFGGGFAEVLDEGAARERVVDAVAVADGVGGELDDGAGLDV